MFAPRLPRGSQDVNGSYRFRYSLHTSPVRHFAASFLLFFWRSSRQRGGGSRQRNSDGFCMSYSGFPCRVFSLLLRFIYLLNFPNTIPKHRRTYFKRPEETSKIFPKNLSLLFSPISWSSTRKRDVSKLRGITGLGFPRSTECGTPPVRVYPLFDSHPGRIFEGPLSSRAASKRVFASSVTGTSYGEEGGRGRNPCKHRGP